MTDCSECKHRKKKLIPLDNGKDGYFCYMWWAYIPKEIVTKHVCEKWEGIE